MSVKIPLPNTAELSQDLQDRLGASPINVTRMMANAPVSLQGFQEFAGSILFRSEFDPRKRELAVLRVAHATKADYEWTHHVRVGMSFGITKKEVDAIATEEPVTSLDEEANLLCRVADEISLNVRLSDDALSQILDRYGVRGAMELILCISYFNMVSRILESTRVELEEGITPRFLK